tara:strand:+ start:118 stop:462 length:345 start_codon:yes stop_codon:yes gene_type:complete
MSLTSGAVGVSLLALILFALVVILVVHFNKKSENKYDPLTAIDKTFTKDELDQVVKSILNRISQIDSEISLLKMQIKNSNLVDGIHSDMNKFASQNVAALTNAVVNQVNRNANN